MKVVFLDVDGVLNRITNGMFIATHPQPFQRMPLCTEYNTVMALEDWCHEHELGIVVSSTWRKVADSAENFAHLTGLDEGLLHNNWRTPLNGPDRGDEIDQWLKAHPEVTHHVIFDDNIYNILDFKHLNLVQTNDRDGLLAQDFRDAEKFLV